MFGSKASREKIFDDADRDDDVNFCPPTYTSLESLRAKLQLKFWSHNAK